MDCRQVDRCLEANLDGRLSGFERVALRQHLKVCRPCRAKVEAMRSFSAVIERTLAAADGPDWHRLTPPAMPRGLREPRPEPFVPTVAAPRPERQRRRPWRSVAVVAASVLLLLASQVLWPVGPAPVSDPVAGVTVALAPTAPTLLAEATRRAAQRSVDYPTADWFTAQRWLEARDLGALPDFEALADLRLVGVFLEHVAGQRAAGIALHGNEGPFSLYLMPAVDDAAAFGWAESGGLVALAGALDGWQAVLVGSSGQVFPGALSDRLRGVAPDL